MVKEKAMQGQPEPVAEKQLTSQSGRNFFLRILFFENGCFIAISEESFRIGSVAASISSTGKVNTARVIPSRYDSMFATTLTERISTLINGVCLVSLHTKSQLELDDMKAIMGELMNIIEGKWGGKN